MNYMTKSTNKDNIAHIAISRESRISKVAKSTKPPREKSKLPVKQKTTDCTAEEMK